jgi:predicted transposase YbfD/YdcC
LGLITSSASRATKAASWSEQKSSCRSVFFPSEYDTGWVKDHGRLERCQLQRVAVSPEESGLCGCWQFIAVWRQRGELRQGKVVEKEEEYQFYCTSLAQADHPAQELVQMIRGHWSACEIGAHYRRDVTLKEDASRIREAAQPMATLRNLVLGLFELQKDREQTKSQYVPNWQRKMTASMAIQLIKIGP